MVKTNSQESHGGDSPASSVSEHVHTHFFQFVQDASRAMKHGDFALAARLYTDAIILDPANHVLYSNRSAAHLRLNQWDEALHDARKCKQMKPDWSKGYLREAAALKQMGRHADALASFCVGLSLDPQNRGILQSLRDALADSTLKDRFAPFLDQLVRLKQDENPFLVTSVIGQELLKMGKHSASVLALDAALHIGTTSLLLKGSVLSALSSAHWGLGNVDKAITFMQQDLATAKAIGDLPGECRSYANLGAAYFSKGDYKVAFQYRRLQLTSVIHLKDYSLITSALSHLGHVCSAVGDYRSALLSHKRCALLAKQKRDRLVEAREIGSVGAVYLASGDIARALECHQEHLGIAREIGNQVEEARAYSNLGSAYHYQRQFDRAIAYHEEVLRIAALLGDQTLEARAYSGLGHAARCMRDYPKAKHYHEKQLDNALQTKDKMAEGRSCSNLGIVYQLLGEYEAALKLHKAHLQIAKDLGDRVGQGRAYGNIGNAYSALGQFELAIRFHKQELAISKEVRDRHAESSTHGNLAFAYQALRMKDQALHSYSTHLSMAQALRDKGSESRALCNIGNYLCAMKLYDQALPYYEKFLALSEELGDKEGWGTACHGLGYVHYRLGNFAKAVRYYEKDLVLARGLLDKSHVCRALCNLGLAQKALGSYRDSLDSQRQFLAVASELKNVTGKFCALGNVGDVLLHVGEGSEAVKMFNQQLHLARISNDRKLEAISLGNLGNCCRMLGQLDKALSYHMQELTIYQDLTNNPKAESQAHGCIGNIHMTLGNYMSAYRSYEEQLDRSRESGDVEGEAMAYGNMGITKMNARMYEDAIGFFEQQLALLEQLNGSRTHAERGRATRNMGDCYDAIGEHREAIRCYESYLAMNPNSLVDQNRAYHSLGCAYQATGSLHQALICFEKRLVIAHSLGDLVVVGRAYGELGCLHSLTGNFEQAINYLQHQRRIARDIGDPTAEAEAACALGGVYHQMAEFEKALEYHLIDLELSTKMRDASCQCRAFGNLGLSNESLGRYEEAVAYQLKLLHVASEIKDNAAKTLALTSLGRVYHAVGRYPEAIDSLRQGLKIALDGGQKEDEAKIRHRLGLALWLEGSFEDAQQELYLAVELFESIRRESQYNNDYKMSLFELQTASYQALQRVLVALDRPDEALLVAERARTRAFIDLVLERQNLPSQLDSWYNGVDSSPVTMETIQRTIDQQKCAVLYYSLAAGYLYSWLILPQKGVVKFHESVVAELDELSVAGSDVQSTSTVLTASAITGCISRARESLGIESHLSASRTLLTKSEADDPDLEGRLVQLGDRLNAEKDAVGFLRMTNRSHAWNCSSFSIGSLVSIGSGPNDAERHRVASYRSAASRQTARDDGTKPPLIRLYDLLIGVMEDFLPPTAGCAGCKELVLVLQGDLYLVPFALLRPTQSAACLYERYSLLVAPSVRAMQAAQAISDRCQYNPNCSGAIVVGNPKIPACITAAWHWRPLPATEQECRFVAEMLGCRSLTGSDATRDAVSRDMPQAEVIHFATHISWKLSAIVLARNGSDRKSSWDERSNAIDDSFDGPALSEHLLTAADILNVPIRAKLVVINSSHMDERAGRMNSDGVIGLTRAFLAAGAQCVLFPLWGVPEGASRLLLRNFYRCLLHGTSTSSALAEAMRAVRATRQFAHPSNWACWTLVGSNVRISSKVALMGHGLKALLSTPTKSREAMRVVLHLVEKALQRIQTGQRNAMYMTRSSIENRVGDVSGWQDILVAMGFRFESEPANGQAATVFFPTSDPGERLTQCSASLQALLGLSVPSLICLAKIKELPDVGLILTSLLKDFLGRFPRHTTKTSPSLIVGIEVWKRSGTHEFLASLGFELVEVGNDEVTVRLGKNASRRVLHYSLQALMAVFDVQDAPRVLLESSSSMESLVSTSESVTSPISNLGSSPPVSPLAAAKKSYFNPAEVDKLPSAMKNLVSTGSKSSLCPSASGPDLNLQLAHQTLIRSKYSSPSTSDMSDANMTYDQRSTVTPGREDNERGGKQRSGPMSVKMRTSQGQGYSTSASDGEDVWACPDGAGVLGGRSRTGGTSSGSQGALQLSGRTGGNGGRRMRPRVQASGNRVAAGEGFVAGRDMTSLSGELYDLNVAMDSLTDSGIQSTPKQTDSNTDHSTDREDSALGKHGTSMVRGIRNQATGDNLTLRPLPTSEVPRSLPDFGTVAQKVLADTDRCREVVEAIQNVPRNTVPSERGRNLEKLHLSGGGRTGQNVSCLSNGSDEAVHLLLGEIKSIPGFTGQVPPLGFRHKPDSSNGCESQILFGKKQALDSSRSHVKAMENLHQSNKASNSKPQFGKNRSVVLEGGLIARSEQPNSSTRSVGHESKGFQSCSRAKGHHNAGDVCRTFDSDRKFLIESESKVTPLQNRLIPNSASESSSFHKNAHPLSLTGVPRNTSNVLHRPSFVFPDAVRNRPFPSQEDLAAPYVANFPPTVLKDALANIPPPLPGRYRPLLPKPTTWDARSCDFNSPRSLQKASALFFRNNSDWSAFSRPKQTTGKANENTPGHSELPQNRNSNAHLNLGYLSSELGDKPTLCVLEEESSPSDNSWVGRPQPASSSRYIEGTETTSQKAETSSRVRMLSENFNATVEDGVVRSKPWQQTTSVSSQPRQNVRADLIANANAALHASRC